MKRKSDFINAFQQLRLRGGVAFRYSWIGLLFLVITLKQTSVFADYGKSETNVHHQATLLFSDLYNNSQITPYHLPFELDFSQQVKEAPDENDFEEDVEDECAVITETTAVKFPLHLFSDDFSKVAKHNTLQNRSSVPLFILYHSWKSFIA